MKYETKNLISFYIGSFSISLLSAYFIWLQTSRYGIGIDPGYPEMAEDFLKFGLTFVFYSKNVTFAPLYPLTLAAISNIFNTDIFSIARWFNVVLAFSFTFLSTLLCRKLTKNLAILFAFGLFISFSKPINEVFSWFWSEPLFIFIILLITFSIEKNNYKNLILCSFLSTLAILTRYAGVAIVPAVCLYLFIQKNGLPEKVKKCFCYSVIPTSTYIIYLIRNYYFTKTLMGHRISSSTGFLSNIDRAVLTIVSWFSGSYFFLTLAVFLISGAFIWAHKKDFLLFYSNISGTIKFSICFIIIYSLFIVSIVSTTALDPLTDRFMSPVYLSSLLFSFSFIIFTISKYKEQNKILIFSIFLLLAASSLLSFYKTSKGIILRTKDGAGGANSILLQESPITDYIRKNIEKGTLIFTNNSCVKLVLKDYKFSTLPQKFEKETADKPTDVTLDNLLSRYPNFENNIIVWWEKDSPNLFFSPYEIRNICDIEQIMNIPGEGFLFKVDKCSKPTNTRDKNE